MNQLLVAIRKSLNENADTALQQRLITTVPGAGKCYGVSMPLVSALSKQYKAGGFALIRVLWESGMYEEQLLALKILGAIAKKDAVVSLKMVEEFSGNIQNWAVCDTMGMQSLKPLVKTHQQEIFALAKKLNNSGNMWQRRLSLVLVEYYTRDKSLHPLIIALMKPLENDKEYYIKKAIAWLKRNLDKGK